MYELPSSVYSPHPLFGSNQEKQRGGDIMNLNKLSIIIIKK